QAVGRQRFGRGPQYLDAGALHQGLGQRGHHGVSGQQAHRGRGGLVLRPRGRAGQTQGSEHTCGTHVRQAGASIQLHALCPLRAGVSPRTMAASPKSAPAVRMMAAPEGTGSSSWIGTRMPICVLSVANSTLSQKKPRSDRLSRRAAAAGMISSAPTRMAPITLTEATVTRVTSTTNR